MSKLLFLFYSHKLNLQLTTRFSHKYDDFMEKNDQITIQFDLYDNTWKQCSSQGVFHGKVKTTAHSDQTISF